jgi:serine/threonine protein kinase HipA of HipAB toxin-antitoxin module
MDDSPFLRQDQTQQFQSLIGAMQWAVLIRRLDIATAVMSLSSFHANAKERQSRESQVNLWLSTKDERSKDSSAYQ